MSHRITPDANYLRCTCGWAYTRPTLLDEWRSNRAIRKHLAGKRAPAPSIDIARYERRVARQRTEEAK